MGGRCSGGMGRGSGGTDRGYNYGQSYYRNDWGRGNNNGNWYGSNRDDDPDIQLSKKMSQVLRHMVAELGLDMSADGFVVVRDLLQVKTTWLDFDGVTESDVMRIVKSNKKQRFSLGEDERGYLTVRANQGHTGSTGAAVNDEALLTEIVDASELERVGQVCVHGTYWAAW